MAAHDQDLSRAAWRKSTHSSQDGNCVEVAANLPGIVAIRDSKNPDGPKLKFTRQAWADFMEVVQAEQFTSVSRAFR
jgi:Domain of unknown function (DUF397)